MSEAVADRKGGLLLRKTHVEVSNNNTWRRALCRLEIEGLDRVLWKASTAIPFVENARARLHRCVRSLSMLHLALISQPARTLTAPIRSKTSAPDGDCTFREFPPRSIRATWFLRAGYDPVYVQQDVNVRFRWARLLESKSNRVIGQLNSAFWSFCGFIPDASAARQSHGAKTCRAPEAL